MAVKDDTKIDLLWKKVLWAIAGFQLKSNVDGEENVVLHMGDIQLVDGLVSRIIVYENQRPKKE